MTQATELRELATLLDVSSGNVGIGLPSGTASNKLVISDGVRTSAAITAGTTALEIARTGGGDVGILINKDTAKWLIGVDNSDGNSAPLRFLYGAYNAAAHPGFGTAADGLNLSYNGNVGIGVKTPSAKLHINSSSLDPTGIGLQNNSRYMGIEVEGGGLRVKDVSAGLVERFRIAGSGDVTIGDITAEHKLDVDGSIGTRQVRHDITPTLNLDFANSKELDSRITFYRKSVATYYDSKGILRYANYNEPRFDHDPITGESKGLLIEESRRNLVLLSDNIVNNATWTISGSSTFIEPNAGVAPDGTYSASRIKFGSSSHVVAQNVGSSISVGGTVTTSMWVKGTSGETLRFASGGTDFGNETLTGEWQRVVGTRTAINTTVNINTYGGATARDVLIWGVQCETAPYATSYIPSETRFNSRTSKARYHDKDGILRTANKNTPRYGYKYDGKKWVETGLILETAATNMILNNTGYNDRYNAGGMEIASLRLIKDQNDETTTAPDGSTVPVFVGTGVSGGSYVYPSGATGATINSGSPYTFSVYVRRPTTFNGINTRSFSIYTHTGRFPAYDYLVWDFDTDAFARVPTAAHISNYGYELLNNGWVRLYMTATPNSTGGAFGFVTFFADETSDGSSTPLTDSMPSGVRQGYIWGAQLENAKSPSSYIPTYGSAVTRSADVVDMVSYTRDGDSGYIDGKDFEDFYNPDEGTIHIDYQLGPKLAQMRIAALTKHGTSTDYIDIIGGWGSSGATTGGVYMFGPNSTGSSVDTAGSTITNVAYERRKFAGRIAHNDFYSVTQNSTTIAQQGDTDAGISVFDRLNFGDYNMSDSQKLCGHIRKIVYYPEALTNAELIALTENN